MLPNDLGESDGVSVASVPVELASLVIGDESQAWVDAGFAATGNECRVGQVRLIFVGGDKRRGIIAWSFRGLAKPIGNLDGIPVGPAEEASGDADAHPNGVTELDHVVVTTPDRGRTVAALEAIGLDVRRVRELDGTGHEPATQTFFRLGRPILELVAPADREEGPAGFFGLAFDVADIDSLPSRYGEGLGPIKQAVQPGRRIATVRHRDLGLSVRVAFMTPDPGSRQARAPLAPR